MQAPPAKRVASSADTPEARKRIGAVEHESEDDDDILDGYGIKKRLAALGMMEHAAFDRYIEWIARKIAAPGGDGEKPAEVALIWEQMPLLASGLSIRAAWHKGVFWLTDVYPRMETVDCDDGSHFCGVCRDNNDATKHIFFYGPFYKESEMSVADLAAMTLDDVAVDHDYLTVCSECAKIVDLYHQMDHYNRRVANYVKGLLDENKGDVDSVLGNKCAASRYGEWKYRKALVNTAKSHWRK